MPEHGRVSGKLVVFLLFGGALLLWGIVFVTGYREKLAGQGLGAGRPPADIVSAPDSVRVLLRHLPQAWIKVSRVEGQGFVVFIPCYSANSEIAFRTPLDSASGLSCEYCDSLGDLSIRALARHSDTSLTLVVEPPAGEVRILPVNEALLAAFPEAPFRDRLLLWIRNQEPDSTGAAAPPDTMFFVPKTQENEFEVLRAEDENPEGCGGENQE